MRYGHLAVLVVLVMCALLVQGSPAWATFSFDLGLSAEIHLRPGDVVNLPARLLNTGDETIQFRTIVNNDEVGLFVNQFNGLTLPVGEKFDFVFGAVTVADNAPIGASQNDFSRLLGITFPGHVRLESGHDGPCCFANLAPNASTRLVIDTEVFATSLDRYSSGEPGYFDIGRFDLATINIISLTFFDFGSISIAPNPNAIDPPIVPEPSAWLLLGSGLAGLALWRTVDPREPKAGK